MIEIIIPTKDHPVQLHNIIAQVRAQTDDARIIIVDNSDSHLNLLYHVETIIHTPKTKMGKNRQLGLEACQCQYALYLDDDLILTPNFIPLILFTIIKTKATVVSSSMIFGEPVQRTIAQLYRMSDQNYGSGAIIVDVKKLKAAGGWATDLHMGEDTELRLRLGEQWLTSKIEVWHPITFGSWLKMATKHSQGGLDLVSTKHVTLSWAIKRFITRMTLPFVYGWRAGSIKICLYYLIYRIVYGFGVIRWRLTK